MRTINTAAQKTLLRRRLRIAALALLVAAVVAGIVVARHALNTTTARQGSDGASVAHVAPGCHRELTAAEISILSGLGVSMRAMSAAATSQAISASAAFTASTQQLEPSAITHASDIACELASVSAPNIHPLINGAAATIQNRLLWIVMYQGLGPGSHGPSTSGGPRDLYMFFDASDGAYLFGLSGAQPPKA